VAYKLNEMGIPSPAVWRSKKSRGWYSSRVRTILKSSTYSGVYRWGDILVPVPSIVSTKEQAQAVWQLDMNVRFSVKDAKHQYLLRGLIRCAECNHTFTGSVVSGHKYYGCEGRKHPQKYNMERCHAPHLPGDRIEAWVWSKFVSVIEKPEEIEIYINRQNEADDINLEAELVLLGNRIETLERERVNAMRAAFRETIVDDAALNRAIEEINSQLEASKKARSELLAHGQRDALWHARLMETRRRLYELQGIVHQNLPDDLRRALLQKLVDGIEVGVEKIGMRIASPSFERVNYGKGPAVPSAIPLSKSPLVIETPTIDSIRIT
jgi:site-specific DNA recombinase